ncbi:50S ribosomal protein L21 [Sedimentisphaera cyanobacteriorum]|uniref:Large ribosomal subunit protein bL21 n=1 Tax=Sedimentisphaera cyanobacteriorum TaxID=1940790 RepID=A0A1Q2HR46_9BACT|nr:50S ribosomal protein L21 [Sedimentisphaera cyanobacteriorum]AQQ09927.1 50S ribosomal protein L21 [Sedimentisphaera cyanobacteriorum]
MYAIVEQGGKQYKVSQGDVINIELTDLENGAEVLEMDKVLFVSDGQEIKIGKPYIDGAKVTAKVKYFDKKTGEEAEKTAVFKGKKVYPTYFRRRKHSRKRVGHRQKYLQVVVDAIEA